MKLDTTKRYMFTQRILFDMNLDKLHRYSLQQLEHEQQKTLLIGVTYALLDFAEQFPMTAYHTTTVMETGGMKGRRKELDKK